MKRFALLVAVVVFVIGCNAADEKAQPGAVASALPGSSAASVRKRSAMDPSAAAPQKLLAGNEVRMAILVLPGDATVEVDKVPVRRRNGMIELVGSVGDEHQVQVFLGSTPAVEQNVKIAAAGTEPMLIDANEPSNVKSGPANAPAIFDVNEEGN